MTASIRPTFRVASRIALPSLSTLFFHAHRRSRTSSLRRDPQIQTGYSFATGPLNQRLIALSSSDGVAVSQTRNAQSQSFVVPLMSDAATGVFPGTHLFGDPRECVPLLVEI